jgi:hypothetical protein
MKLQIPETFLKLTGFVCPAEFWPALGYEGEARYVAIYWEPAGDEASYDDGRVNLCGANWTAYQTLLGFQESGRLDYAWQFQFETGSSEEPAKYWIVIDRQYQEHMAWLVSPEEASFFLRLQWPELVAIDEGELPAGEELPPIDWMALQAEITRSFREIPIPSHEEIVAAMRRDQELLAELKTALANWRGA